MFFLFTGNDVVDDKEPEELSELPTSTTVLVLPTVSIKNDENSSASEQRLLSKITPSFQSKAKLLLEAFNDNPQQLTWSDEGAVLINSQSVPNANIFELFPAVFKTPVLKNQKLPGFTEFVSEIGSLGLGHLIHPKFLRGLKRKKKIANQMELYNELKNGHWYFLGPI